MRRSLMLLSACILALALTIGAAASPRFPGDLPIALWLQGLKGWQATIFELASGVGGHTILGVGAAGGVVLLARKRWTEAVALLILAGFTLAIPFAKELIERDRPDSALVTVFGTHTGDSYPSGHVFFAMAILGGMLVYTRALLGDRRLLVLGFQAALAATVLDISLSRVYRGAHWPSDVLGTPLIAGLLVVAVVRATPRYVTPATQAALQRAFTAWRRYHPLSHPAP